MSNNQDSPFRFFQDTGRFGKCLTCTKGAERFGFCAQHYLDFNAGLIKKDGTPSRRVELEAENTRLRSEFEEYKHTQAAAQLDFEWGLIKERDKLRSALEVAREALDHITKPVSQMACCKKAWGDGIMDNHMVDVADDARVTIDAVLQGSSAKEEGKS